jgi:hypothetical protein
MNSTEESKCSAWQLKRYVLFGQIAIVELRNAWGRIEPAQYGLTKTGARDYRIARHRQEQPASRSQGKHDTHRR